ncbi:Outer membrane porin protein BP0840 precursor [Delftia tsuruhatensis]|uniref:porin n=1 Tax=Delftia tsuruhatensis TaxID=180282 RepID=UPI001E6A2FD1|nr:porin [Delftia tsuruhatensis]CAB5686999.1 Outer membrane porin protein BP0840 precursor [Delftia tsuruhatensis]CAC9690559.1 Outer membrane porin protein BP0840 precursor [Delftia tsuruhatensis]
MSLRFLALTAALSVPIAAPLAAQAQTSLTLYGIADAGLRYGQGLSAANAPAATSSTGLASGVNTTSRFGLRGREDLGGGLYALFNVETGLNLDTGTTANAGKFFDRAAIVGLGGTWGQVTAGRQTNLLADAISPVDAAGMRFASFNPNIATAALSSHGLGLEYGTAGASTGSYRLDNALKYTGRFGPWTARAMYSFGETAQGGAARSSAGAGLSYTSNPWTVSGAFQRFRTSDRLTLEAATLGAAYQAGSLRLALNTARSDGQTSATSRTVQRVHSAGVTWAATRTVDLTAALYRVDRERSGKASDGYTRALLFAEYKLSKRSKLYAELDRTRWSGGYQGPQGKSQATGLTTGLVHHF